MARDKTSSCRGKACPCLEALERDTTVSNNSMAIWCLEKKGRNNFGITHAHVLRHGHVKKPHGRVVFPAASFPLGWRKFVLKFEGALSDRNRE